MGLNYNNLQSNVYMCVWITRFFFLETRCFKAQITNNNRPLEIFKCRGGG